MEMTSDGIFYCYEPFPIIKPWVSFDMPANNNYDTLSRFCYLNDTLLTDLTKIFCLLKERQDQIAITMRAEVSPLHGFKRFTKSFPSYVSQVVGLF